MASVSSRGLWNEPLTGPTADRLTGIAEAGERLATHPTPDVRHRTGGGKGSTQFCGGGPVRVVLL